MTRVSVVIPCYNHGLYLGEAIESVLKQSRPADEIIVVDDGSTDDSGEVAGKYKAVKYVIQENQGLAAARNAGARASDGDFLVFLDADDHLTQTAIESGLQCHDKQPGCGLVYGAGRMFYEAGRKRPPAEPVPPGPDAYEHLLRSNYIWMIHMSMYRRDAFEAAGGFTSGVDATADYGFNLTVARLFPIAMHSALVAECRYLPESMSRNLPVMLASVRRVMDQQWKFVAGDRKLERAWRIGRRNWTLVFTKLMLRQTETAIRNHGPWTHVRRNSLALFRYGPAVAVRAAGRQLNVLKRRVTEPGHTS